MVFIIGASWPFPDDLIIMLALEVPVLAGLLALYCGGWYDDTLAIPFNGIIPIIDCEPSSGLLTTFVVVAISCVVYCSNTSMYIMHFKILSI
jgi:hypothetical protein